MKKVFLMRYIAIVLTSLACYLPSIFHVPRADQIAYLAEVSHKNDFISLAIQSFDLSRTRLFVDGDGLLFRPVVYFFLGVEKCLFGYNFMYWQITGILLHLVVVGFLLKLLLNIRNSFLAYIFTAYLSVSLVSMEMVVWHHINAYLIFIIMMLISFDQIYSYINHNDSKFWRLIIISFSLMIACFTYELANVCAVLILVYFCMLARKEYKTLINKTLIIGPVLFYFMCSSFDWIYLLNNNLTPPLIESVANKGLLKFLENTFINVISTQLHWLLFVFFPSQINIILGDRISLNIRESFYFLSSFSLGLVILFSIILTKARFKWSLFKKWRFNTLLFWVIFSYTLFIVLGRINIRGYSVLTSNLYYVYLYLIFFLIFIYASIDFDILEKYFNFLFLKLIILVLIIPILITSAYRIYEINNKIAVSSLSCYCLIQRIEKLKKGHYKDGDFSFYISDSYPGNYTVTWLKKKGDFPGRKYSFIEALYFDCFDKVNPRYIVD